MPNQYNAYAFHFTKTIDYLSIDLWRLFKFVELTQVMRQTDKDFIEMLNKIRKGLVDESSEKMLRSRFVDRSNSNYPKYGLNVFAENAPVSSHNVGLLNELSNNEIEIHSIDTIPTNCKILQCQITAAQNQSQSKTGGLKLKISAKVMLTVHVDIKDRLINGLIGIIKHFEIIENVVSTIFIEFDDVDAGRNLTSINRFAIQNNWVPIKGVTHQYLLGIPQVHSGSNEHNFQ